MKDLVKQLIAYPEFLLFFLVAALGLGISLLSLIIHFSKRQTVASTIEKAFTTFFVFNTPVYNLPILFSLNPTYFYKTDAGFFWSAVQISLYLLVILALGSGFRHFFKNAALLFKDPCLGGLLGLTLLSASWSLVPDYTLKSGLVLVGMSAFAAHINKRFSWQETSAILRWAFAICAVLSFAFAVLQPAIGVEGKGWRGITSQPNRLGPIMAINAVFWLQYLIQTKKHRWLSCLIVILSLISLALTNSSTSILTFLLLSSLLALANILRHLSFKQGFITIIIFLFFGIILYYLLTESLAMIMIALGKDPSLTGRTDFWPQLIEKIWERPLLGYGYNGFWLPWLSNDPSANISTNDGSFRPPHAHNGFIDLGIHLGVVGLFLFAVSFFRSLALAIQYVKLSKAPEAIFPLLILVFLVVSNISESTLLSANYTWFYYVLVATRLNMGLNMSDIGKAPIPFMHSSASRTVQ